MSLPPVGVFILGARGSVGACVALGTSGLRSGRFDATGLVTAREPFARVPLVDPSNLVLGGMDVRRGTLRDSALAISRQGIVGPDVVEAEMESLEEIDGRIVPGFLDAPDVELAQPEEVHPETLASRSVPPSEVVSRTGKAIELFQARAAVKTVVVVNLASTEAARPSPARWSELSSFEHDLAAGAPIPVSTLYAYAAIQAGCPYVNFTPSLGASPGALDALARARGVPHAGCDGKTGETLVKTALAPMFRDRNLQVLAWEGYNLLGNADGKTLSDPAHKAAKLLNKDEALRRVLGDRPDLHTRVGIEYVPSLGDWKTAWDFIHFRGFLGTRMTLQFTWTGSDSALAAPLVLDLVRLAELSCRRGESGAMAHAAAFFKSPLGTSERDFHRQNQRLEEYARAASE
jgi:myo-inositol-1-phosphate synthase